MLAVPEAGVGPTPVAPTPPTPKPLGAKTGGPAAPAAASPAAGTAAAPASKPLGSAETQAQPQQVVAEIQKLLASLPSPEFTAMDSLANPGLSGGISPQVGDETQSAEDAIAQLVAKDAASPEGQAATTAADGRQLRLDAITDPNKERRVINQLRQVSQGEYDGLTDQQRAAYDFNRMLVQAVHKDRKLADKYDPTPAESAALEADVEKMFGAGRGSVDYAPETVALLKQLGIQDQNAGLDDYLGLDAAIGRKQIERMVDHQAPAPAAPGTGESAGLSALESMDPIQRERFGLADRTAHDTAAMEASMVRGNQLLATIDQVAAQDRNDLVTRYGGRENKLRPDLGYDTALATDETGKAADLNTYFQQAFNLVASGKVDADAVMADAENVLSPESLSKFRAYLNNRSMQALQLDLPLGEGDGWLTPEEFRKALKITPGGP